VSNIKVQITRLCVMYHWIRGGVHGRHGGCVGIFSLGRFCYWVKSV
jgi:hypothetical protein